MILIGTDAGIYRWFDGCGWPIFHALQDRSIVDLASPGGGVLVALDREGTVYESVNNGQDWRTIPLAEGAGRPSALGVWGTAPTVIVLATARPLGLYRRVLGAPVPRLKAERKPASPALIHRAQSLAAGATDLLVRRRNVTTDPRAARAAGWTALGVPKAGTEIRALAFGQGVNAPWFASVRGAGLWRSTDLGANWLRCAGIPDEVYALRLPPQRPGTVWAGTSNGCWLSTDGGQNWEERSNGLDKERFVAALEVKPGTPDTLLAGVGPFAPEAAASNSQPEVGYALFESKDGGKTWSHVTKKNHPEVIERDAIADIRYDPAAPDNILDALASGEVRASRNDGAYWGPIARQTRAARVLCATV
ncbi:MAG: sialidase family protein [Isosphaeraceae bacterium]|nr:sialidase family protein [Isosphaeraceae bacterium]